MAHKNSNAFFRLFADLSSIDLMTNKIMLVAFVVIYSEEKNIQFSIQLKHIVLVRSKFLIAHQFVQ